MTLGMSRRLEDLVESYVAPILQVMQNGAERVVVDFGEVGGRHVVPAPVAAHLCGLFQLARALETRLYPGIGSVVESEHGQPVVIAPRPTNKLPIRRGGSSVR